jgi:muramidase (phage lysozyme)
VAGKSSGFAITVAVQDDASKGLDKINRQIAALNAPAERFNKSLAKFGEVTGINRAAEGMQTLGDRALGAARAVERMAGPMASITSIGSLGGLMEMSRRWADAGNSISRTADLLNTPVHKLSQLELANRLAGGSADSLDSSMKGLQQTLAEAKKGGPLATLLNSYKISFQGVGKEARSAGEAIGEVAHVAASYKDPHGGEHFLELLHMDPGLLPFFQQYDKFMDQAQKTGGVLTDDMAQKARDLNTAWTRVGETIEGVINRLGERYSPAIQKELDRVSKWIEDHPDKADWIATAVAKATAAVAALGALKIAPWILRALGWLLPGEATVPAALAVGGEEAIYYGTRVGDTQTQAQEDAILGGTFAQRHPGNVVGPSDGSVLDRFWKSHAPRWLGEDGGPRTSNVDLTMDPTKLGFLNTIAGPESGGRYNIKNGWSPTNDNASTRFSDYSRFPEGVAPGGTSTAAGAFQILSGTDKSLSAATGLDDFLPETQRKKAWYLATTAYRAKTGRDLESDLQAGNHQMQIASALNSIWPTLPGGSQSHGSLADFDTSLGQNTAAIDRWGRIGHVQVDVHVHGVTPGTTAQATASGIAHASPPTIGHSMPMVPGGVPWSNR